MKQTTIETFDSKYVTDAFNSLNITPLSEKLSEMFGFKIELTKQLNETHSFGSTHTKINIFCKENLVEHCGIISLGLQKAELKDFGVHVHKIIEYDEEKFEEHKKTEGYTPISCFSKIIGLVITLTLDIRYTLSNGGSNGITILSASYDVNSKTWSYND